MLDLSLLQSPTFLILAISGFLTLFCFFVPFAFLGALADERIANYNNKNNSFITGSHGKNEINNNGSDTQILLVLLGLSSTYRNGQTII